MIFENVVLPGKKMTKFVRAVSTYGALALLLTCKRFYYIIRPLLYQCPSSAFLSGFMCMVPPQPQTLQFFRALELNPMLETFCKRLTISISESGVSSQDFDLAPALSMRLHHLTNLKVFGGFCHLSTWTMIVDAVNEMPKLEVLELKSGSGNEGPLLRDVYKDFLRHPALRRLVLDGAQEGPPSSDSSNLPAAVRFFPTEDYSSNLRGTSGVTQLYIRGPDISAETLAKFLLWPKALEDIFLELDWARQSSLWRSKHIEIALRPHRRSLKSIILNTTVSNNDSPTIHLPHEHAIDLTDFEELVSFSTASSDLPSSPETAASKLIGPKLKWLTFNYEDECYKPDEAFLAWCQRFVAHAITQHSELRRLTLTGLGYYEENELLVEQFQKLRQESQAQGLEIVCVALRDNIVTETQDLAEFMQSVVWDVEF